MVFTIMLRPFLQGEGRNKTMVFTKHLGLISKIIDLLSYVIRIKSWRLRNRVSGLCRRVEATRTVEATAE